MTEQDKNLIVRLWENGESMSAIVKMLPYKTYHAKQMVLELRQNGVLKGRSGKTKAKTLDKIKQVFNSGITSKYAIAETLGLKTYTVDTYLTGLKLKRKRPSKNYKSSKVCKKTEQIIQELREGKKIPELVIKYDVTRQYIYKIKNKYLGANI